MSGLADEMLILWCYISTLLTLIVSCIYFLSSFCEVSASNFTVADLEIKRGGFLDLDILQ